MANKVHPQVVVDASTSSEQQVFTLWMKSLILNTNGCAVFDSDGRIVYRVDNYCQKSSKQVHVMDSTGKVLFTILKKKFSLLGVWEGYRSDSKATNNNKLEKPGFRVRKLLGIRMIIGFLTGHSCYKVVVRLNDNQPAAAACDQYVMENQISKTSCRIVDTFGGLAAEVKRKVTSGGVVLGEDVLTMVVEPHIDHSLIMGLVVVFGLIHHKL